MKYKFDPSELTREKTLWDVYRLSRKIQPGRLQIALNAGVAFFLCLNAFFTIGREDQLLADIRTWSLNGFGFAVATLGFLVAGFTIFITVAKPEMMLAMMDHTDRETGIPTLKKNIISFMAVFIAYLACAGLYLLILLFGQSKGGMSFIIAQLPHPAESRAILIKVGYVIVGTSLFYLLLMLKSFIFNVYAIVMNFLRWERYEADRSSLKRKDRGAARIQNSVIPGRIQNSESRIVE